MEEAPKKGLSRIKVVACFFGTIAILWATASAYNWYTDPLRPIRGAITFEYTEAVQQMSPGGKGYIHVLNTTMQLKMPEQEVVSAFKNHLQEPTWQWQGSVVMRTKKWAKNPHYSDRIYIYRTNQGTEIKFEREISAAQYHMRQLANSSDRH